MFVQYLQIGLLFAVPLTSLIATEKEGREIQLEEFYSQIEKLSQAWETKLAGKTLEVRCEFSDKAYQNDEESTIELCPDVEALLEVGGKNRFSVIYRRWESTWRGGAAPTYVSNKHLVFDGETLLNLESAFMNVETMKPGDRLTGYIDDLPLDTPPYSMLHTGQGFLSGHLILNKNSAFSRLVEKYGKDSFNFKATEEKILFSAQKKVGNFSADLEGSVSLRAPQLSQIESVEWSETLTEGGKTTTLKQAFATAAFVEIGNGISYPAKATYKRWKDGELRRDYSYTVASVKILETGDMEQAFNLVVPPNTTIIDARIGQEYKVGEKPKQLLINLDSYVNSVDRSEPKLDE